MDAALCRRGHGSWESPRRQLGNGDTDEARGLEGLPWSGGVGGHHVMAGQSGGADEKGQGRAAAAYQLTYSEG